MSQLQDMQEFFDTLIELHRKQNPDMEFSDEKAIMVEVEEFLSSLGKESAEDKPLISRQWSHEKTKTRLEVAYRPANKKDGKANKGDQGESDVTNTKDNV